jgi:hypothetical protein
VAAKDIWPQSTKAKLALERYRGLSDDEITEDIAPALEEFRPKLVEMGESAGKCVGEDAIHAE